MSITKGHLIRRNKTNIHKIMTPIQSQHTELNYSKETELKREKLVYDDVCVYVNLFNLFYFGDISKLKIVYQIIILTLRII